jgi:hypothetical protein
LMAFFAVWFFLFPAYRCSLTVSNNPNTGVELFIGYWSRESLALAMANVGGSDDGNVCVGWNNKDFFDGIWKFGRGVGVLGSLSCPITFVVDSLLIFRRFPLQSSWFYPSLVAMHVVNAAFSGLLLIGLASSTCEIDNCKMARGGYVAILGAVVWLILAYLIWIVRRREMALPNHHHPNPDGVPRTDNKKPPQSEPDVEQPLPLLLLLPAPPPPRFPRKKNNEPPRLALPPSENSRRRRPPPPPKKKKNNNSETPLALPMSENATRQPRPKKSSKKNSADDGAAPPPLEKKKSTKKKKKKAADGETAAATTTGGAPKARKKRTPKKKTDAFS